MQDIPQLEKFVMEGVFWSDTPMLQTIATHEGTTPEHRATVHAALLETLPPMAAYLQLYEVYAGSISLDVAAFIAEYSAGEGKTIPEMQADVRKQQKIIGEIEKDVPLSVNVGLFVVHTAQVRKFLVEKHQTLANAILDLIALKVKMRGEELTAAFLDINKSLGRGVPDIEAVADLEEYMNSLPAELDQLTQGLHEMLGEQVVLEEFEYATADDDFRKFWSTIAWPKRIEEAMELAQGRCVEKRDEFANAQIAEQEAFAKSLNKLEDIVNKFGKYTDLPRSRTWRRSSATCRASSRRPSRRSCSSTSARRSWARRSPTTASWARS